MTRTGKKLDVWIAKAIDNAKKEGYPDPEGLTKKLIAATQDLSQNFTP
jgi:hypothetical protein